MTRELSGAPVAALAGAAGGRTAPGRRPHPAAWIAPLALATPLVAALCLLWGAVEVAPATILAVLLRQLPAPLDALAPVAVTPAQEAIIWQIRLPRVVLAGVVGAGLAAAGAAYQGIFRNPLADPYLIGVAPGASAAAVAALALALPPTFYRLGGVQLSAFAGAMLTVAVVVAFSRVGGRTATSLLVLSGVAVGAFASAITTALMYWHGDRLVAIYTWLLGGFSRADWAEVATGGVPIALGALALLPGGRLLNVLQLGEEPAEALGLPVERLKLALVAAATLLAASAVSVSGIIGFVGLVVPHAVRLVVGPDYRLVMPASLLVGASFLMVADGIARRALAPAELPVGVLTALAGVPFFLLLLQRQKARPR